MINEYATIQNSSAFVQFDMGTEKMGLEEEIETVRK